MNPDNDYVEVYQDDAGEWRWRRVDRGNHKIVSDSGEGYVSKTRAVEAAEALNEGCDVIQVVPEAAAGVQKNWPC